MEEKFRYRVEQLVANIPQGRLMTYGQIATLCGQPRAARIVGGIAKMTQFEHIHSHTERTGLDGVQGENEKRAKRTNGTMSESRKLTTRQSAKNPSGIVGYANKQARVTCSLCDLPWHRVVNKQGGLASGYPGGRRTHARHLSDEGIEVSDDYRVDINSLIWQPATN